MLRGFGPVILSAILAAPAVSAADLALPFTAHSRASAVAVSLHGADVVLICGERDGVAVEVRSRRPDSVPSADLDVRERGASLSISGPPPEDGPSEVVLELVVPPDLPVAVSGSELSVLRSCNRTTTDGQRSTAAAAPKPDPGPGAAPPAGSSFELESSTLELRGPGAARISGSDNQITLVGTDGDLEVPVTGSFVDSSDHHGGMVLDTASTVIVLRSPRGPLGARLDGGVLTILGAAGEASVELADARLEVEDHRGSLSVTARLGDVSVRRGTFSELSVTGEDASARMSGCTATGTVNLARGTLEIDDWVGRLTLQAGGGADLEVAGVDGDLVLSLDDAAIDLRRVTGHTRATASASDLTLAELKSVALSAQGCLVGVVDVPEVKLLRLADGELEMSLAEAKGRQKLDLLGEAWARVELPTPCEVRLSGEGADKADVDVRDCDLRGGSGPGTQRPKRGFGQGPPVILEVSLEAAANLRVEGRPR
ncbi:MAG TPA: hypothetical protein VLT32_22765 [Candidatus Sulfomarinibacteraceae bacterium]|nr:hypothetical protein [Candidatus Sulfomarinibacteraceae bacterium]